jgi:3-deoxy-D-manno-octulosonic-acid transferase
VILLYNILLIAAALLLLPLLVPLVLGQAKYRGRTLQRLGLNNDSLKKFQAGNSGKGLQPVIWVHALSVGEVTSALPLIRAIHANLPAGRIVFTAATRSGKQVADQLISPFAALVLYSPLDLSFAVQRYIAAIAPDLFILVETDFWPNWLHQLKKKRIPAMLVNGRISGRSFASYTRFLLFFKPMFDCFTLLSMQTAGDTDRMTALGIDADKVISLANLKYAMDIRAADRIRQDPQFAELASERIIWVCGSTHKGEEEILFSAFQELISSKNNNKQQADRLFLILAPRDISRGSELVRLGQQYGLHPSTRSSGKTGDNVLILDTIGELAGCYGLARLAFIGGSLVPCGGHNPLEPAKYGVPILFGSHMEDFSEISNDLIACQGARSITADSLAGIAAELLFRQEVHAAMGESAAALVARQRGGLNRYLQEIHRLLESAST